MGKSLTGKGLTGNGLIGNGLTGNGLSGPNIGGRIGISFVEGFLVITGIAFGFNDDGSSRIGISVIIGISLTGVSLIFVYRLFFKYYWNGAKTTPIREALHQKHGQEQI